MSTSQLQITICGTAGLSTKREVKIVGYRPRSICVHAVGQQIIDVIVYCPQVRLLIGS